MLFRFGEYSVNSSAREVRCGDSLVEIEPRAFELLLYLLEHRDRAVGKDELQDKVWGTIVSDSAMTRSVMKLRKSLNDGNESVIKTVPRFGYRFVAEIEDDRDRAQPTEMQSRRKPIVVAAISIAFGAILVLSFVMLRQQDVVDKSVAVLPFDDLSQDQDQQWFADGLAEEILNALSRTPDLAVSSRTSSFTYRGSELDVSSIAKQLGVAHILEGSVRREGDHLRVTAQLIRAEDGFHIWSQNFDHSYADLISIQESVAISIANALETTMDEELLARFVSSGTTSVPAFEEYLKGLSDYDAMIATGDVVTYTSSISRFERAVEIDPDFAQAWYEIARFWSGQMSITGILGGLVDIPREQMNHRYQAAMDRAIQLQDDPAMVLKYRAARAHSAMELKRALQLNTEYLQLRPNDHQARDRQKILLSSLNRYEDLLVFVHDVYELDQRDLVSLARSLLELAFSGDREATEAYALKTAEQVGFNAIGLYQLHRAFLWSGNIGRARDTYEKLVASEMPAGNLLLAKLRQLCAEGKVDAAEELYGAGLLEHPEDMMVVWVAHTIMGEHEAAIDDWRAYDDQDLTQFSGVLQYSMFDPGQYPNLSRFLEEHGEEPGPIRKVPFRCKD